MIERYFLKGIRLKWGGPYDAPQGNMDGSIIANPTPPNRPMTYDGLDGELVDFALPNVKTLGLTKGMTLAFSWLSYAVGHTTRIQTAGDVLTGYMSGCPICQWTANGARWVGHVGTYDANPTVNERVRKTFAEAMPPNVTGFNPAGAWTPGEIAPLLSKFKIPANPSVCALVTNSGEFYSVLVFKSAQAWGPDGYCVGGKKLVPPLDHAALRRWLVPNALTIGRRGT